MKDPRIKKLAGQVMEYSVSLKPGEKVLIEAWDDAEDFVDAFVKADQGLGAYPFVSLQSTRTMRRIIMDVSTEYMEAWFEYEAVRLKDMDAYICIQKKDNFSEYADIPTDKMAVYSEYHGVLHNTYRIPATKWCVLRYPNPAMAQLAGMSTEGFEDYFFDVNNIDYKRLNEISCALNKLCARTDRVRLVAPGTDLTFSIKGMCQEESYCGIFNRPCGETGMNIVQGSANGAIRYNVPSPYQGFLFTDIGLELRDGVVVNATSNDTQRLNKILDTDEGARRISEFALGFNPLITKPIGDILYDEKMLMSLHFTPGNGRENDSAIHWDMIQSHAPEAGGGEVWFDDVLIRKDGLFLPKELHCMNPQELLKEIVTEGYL